MFGTGLPTTMSFSSELSDVFDLNYDIEDSNMSYSFSNTTNYSIVEDTTLHSHPQSSYVVPSGFNVMLLGGYLIIIIIGLPANCLVLGLTMVNQLQNSPNSAVNTINTYITNLASADLLYIFGGIFWAITNYDQSGWRYVCNFVPSVSTILERYCTPNQKLGCFVLHFKIFNTLLENNMSINKANCSKNSNMALKF